MGHETRPTQFDLFKMANLSLSPTKGCQKASAGPMFALDGAGVSTPSILVSRQTMRLSVSRLDPPKWVSFPVVFISTTPKKGTPKEKRQIHIVLGLGQDIGLCMRELPGRRTSKVFAQTQC